jgi:hypothetical protein
MDKKTSQLPLQGYMRNEISAQEELKKENGMLKRKMAAQKTKMAAQKTKVAAQKTEINVLSRENAALRDQVNDAEACDELAALTATASALDRAASVGKVKIEPGLEQETRASTRSKRGTKIM